MSQAHPKRTKKYDLIIVGGGAGGFAAAIRANELKKSALLINAGLPWGGTCVNVGCVPSKTLLWAAQIKHTAQNHGIPGLDLAVKKFDFGRVVRDELSLVRRFRNDKYQKVLANLKSVRAVRGRARLVSPTEVRVGGQIFSAPKLIVATGSKARVPEIPGLREAKFLTHIEALRLKTQPKRLAIIGAGPVGVEFAQMFARFGTKVTLFQRGEHILPRADQELTDRLAQILTKEGVDIKTGVDVKSVRVKGSSSLSQAKIITYESRDRASATAGAAASTTARAKTEAKQGAKKSARQSLIVDEILVATGKIPNTAGLGLEAAGVALDPKGAIKVNKFLETTAKNIFAVGDVTNAPRRLETTAGREGTLAADNAFNAAADAAADSSNTSAPKNAPKSRRRALNYDAVPFTVFTDPQLAGVGPNEQELKKLSGRCPCRTISLAEVPKAGIMRRTEGLIKMVINPINKQIIGVHILAPDAGELIAQAMTLVANKNTIYDVINSVPMFPTLSEGLKIVAMSFIKDITKLSCCT